MDPEYINERFVNVKIKVSVARRYRKYARQMDSSNTSLLDRMMQFFERHQLSPDDELPNHIIKTEKKLLRRINAVIAIIKDIEKKQTLPTVGMLQAIFEAEEMETPKAPRMIEKKFKDRTLEEELRSLKKQL